MKYGTLTLIIFIFGCKAKQEDPPTFLLTEPIFVECDSIREVAKSDFKNGIREYDMLGTIELNEFELFYWKYMNEKYQINIKANDVPTFLEECYAESMNEEIEKEFGKDFIDATYNEAKLEYAKSK